MPSPDKSAIIAALPEERRDFVARAAGAGFAEPTVASFSLSGILTRSTAAFSILNMTVI